MGPGADESHLLGSSPWLQKSPTAPAELPTRPSIPTSTDVLRLNFVPDSITVGGNLSLAARICSVRDTHSTTRPGRSPFATPVLRDVDIQGKSDQVPPSFITFDDPHLPAGTPLLGQYPSGVIDWGRGEWQIGTPFGKFGTFTLALSDPSAKQAEFHFYAPRIFEGVDVYNGGDSDATLSVRSPEIREASYTIKPKELDALQNWLARPRVQK
jgi:hypothetical protein